MHNVPVDICTYVSVWTNVFISLGYVSVVKLLGLCLPLEELPVFQSGNSGLRFCQQPVRAPVMPHPHRRLSLAVSSLVAILVRGKRLFACLYLWAETVTVALGGCQALRSHGQHRWIQNSFIVVVRSLGCADLGKV